MTRRPRSDLGARDAREEVSSDPASVESEWLLARERDPGAPAPSAEIASDYAEIEDLLHNLPIGPSEASWHDEVLRAIAATAAPPRPWWRGAAVKWTTGGGVVTAAAVAALLLWPHTPAELELAIHRGDAIRGDSGRAAVGDRLVVIARPHSAADLRVYRSGILLARCPDGPGCHSPGQGEFSIEVALDAPVQFQVILVVGSSGALPSATMDAYLDSARAVNARIVSHAIDVQ